MPRRLYYRDSYGRWQRAREQEPRRRGLPARPAVWALLLLAAIIVIASLLQPVVSAARP